MDDSCENDVPPPEANEPFSEVPLLTRDQRPMRSALIKVGRNAREKT